MLRSGNIGGGARKRTCLPKEMEPSIEQLDGVVMEEKSRSSLFDKMGNLFDFSNKFKPIPCSKKIKNEFI